MRRCLHRSYPHDVDVLVQLVRRAGQNAASPFNIANSRVGKARWRVLHLVRADRRLHFV
jgi:hypothetical protein